MNIVSVYQDQVFQVSTVVDEKNEPWFMVSEVVKSLNLSNISRALDGLEEDEKQTYQIDNPAYDPKVNGSKKRIKQIFVNESGLYSLMFKSRQERAKKFRRWVTSEVLPSIRKNGFYKMQRDALKPDYKQLASACFMKDHNKHDALVSLERAVNLVNRSITGMTSKECFDTHQLSPRDWILKTLPERLTEYDRIQRIVKEELERGQELLQIRTTLRTMGYKL